MSPNEIRRRTAEKMARAPVGQQATIAGVDPVQQLPKHIPATCRARLAEIRDRCAAKVEAREGSSVPTVDEATLDRVRIPLPKRANHA